MQEDLISSDHSSRITKCEVTNRKLRLVWQVKDLFVRFSSLIVVWFFVCLFWGFYFCVCMSNFKLFEFNY